MGVGAKPTAAGNRQPDAKPGRTEKEVGKAEQEGLTAPPKEGPSGSTRNGGEALPPSNNLTEGPPGRDTSRSEIPGGRASLSG